MAAAPLSGSFRIADGEGCRQTGDGRFFEKQKYDERNNLVGWRPPMEMKMGATAVEMS